MMVAGDGRCDEQLSAMLREKHGQHGRAEGEGRRVIIEEPEPEQVESGVAGPGHTGRDQECHHLTPVQTGGALQLGNRHKAGKQHAQIHFLPNNA